MKTGRNDPCPCGSGKKYKKCCLAAAAPAVDLLWRRLGDAHGALARSLMNFAEEQIHPVALMLGMNQFLGDPELADMEALFGLIENQEELFWPWFFYNWKYDPYEDGAVPDLQADTPIALMYTGAHPDRIDSLQMRLIDATLDAPFSFWEVISATPGRGLHLRDLLTGRDAKIMERMASDAVTAGEILLCRVVQIEHVAMMVGCSQIALPQAYKKDIRLLKQEIADCADDVDDESVSEFEDEVFDCYRWIYRSLTGPPQISNTDGDPISFHMLHYDIDDPHEVAEKLAPLATGVEAALLLKDADRDENGRIVRADLPWFRRFPGAVETWGPQVFGRIDIEGEQLLVMVNSKVRAEAARAEMERRLGGSARYRATEVHALKDVREGGPDDDDPPGLSDFGREELLEDQDLREDIAYMIADHWRDWMDTPIPALQHRTPRQAVKTPEGREIVTRLLAAAEAEARGDALIREVAAGPIATVRRRLGLEIPPQAASVRSDDHESAAGAAIRGLLVDFCGRFLTYEMTQRVFNLCDRLDVGTEFSLNRGRQEIWAAAIVYAIAQLNFLFYTDDPLDVTPEDINTFFGTKPGSVSSKARQIRHTLDIDTGDPDYCTPDIVDAASFYETPEGIIIPNNMIVRDDTGDSLSADQAFRQFFPRSTARPAGRAKQSSRRDISDKQMRLFDD
ncbi:MAG: DUF6398 domain-containing protein [Pseudomonadota bacterium]